MISREEIVTETSGHRDMYEIANCVQAVVEHSGALCGTVHIFNIGSTGIIGTIEYEPGQEKDLPDLQDRLISPGQNYGHERQWQGGNGDSHLQAALMGSEITVPVGKRQLIQGTRQQAVHLEADIKPRTLQIVVSVMGE